MSAGMGVLVRAATIGLLFSVSPTANAQTKSRPKATTHKTTAQVEKEEVCAEPGSDFDSVSSEVTLTTITR
jgi:hypothetical protein